MFAVFQSLNLGVQFVLVRLGPKLKSFLAFHDMFDKTLTSLLVFAVDSTDLHACQ